MKRTALVPVLTFLVMSCVTCDRLSHGQANPQPASDFKARLDEAIKQLSASDLRAAAGPMNAIAGLAVEAHGSAEQEKLLAASLAAVLGSSATDDAKSFACRQLAICGTDKEVPALAALLPNEKLSHMGRFAMERIPGPAADEALLAAAREVKGKLLVGMINSLGDRKASCAVADLAKLLADPDPAVAVAVAAALGQIGAPAHDALTKALSDAPASVRPFVADANVCCADALAAEGKRDLAIAAYDRIRAMDVPAPIRTAATRGAILARGPDGLPLLIEQLKGNDPELFALGLMLAGEMPGAELTKALVATLDGLPPERQATLIDALAHRGDTAAAPAVLRLAKEGDARVRVAAILALARLGNASMIPVLVDMAAKGEGDVARAAMDTLANMPGKEVDDALMAMLKSEDVNVRRIVIEPLGQRRVAAATADLLKAAADADESIRLTAIAALGGTAGEQDVVAMIDLVIQTKGAKELTAAEKSLRGLCARSSDREACAEKLVAALPNAAADRKPSLLQSLGQVGGAKALAAVQSATRDPDETVADAAVRVLGEWPDVAAAEDLMRIAKTSDSPKRKILALRGYVRLTRNEDLPSQKRLAMCQEVMGLCERDDERKFVLGALGAIGSEEALMEAARHFDNPALKNEAAAAAVSIGGKLRGRSKEKVIEVMKRTLTITENKGILDGAQRVLDQAEGKRR